MKRWRKQPSATGLARICQGPKGYELRENGVTIAHVDTIAKNRFTIVGWYWYGFGKNTYSNPVKTAEEAKAQVMAYLKEKG